MLNSVKQKGDPAIIAAPDDVHVVGDLDQKLLYVNISLLLKMILVLIYENSKIYFSSSLNKSVNGQEYPSLYSKTKLLSQVSQRILLMF